MENWIINSNVFEDIEKNKENYNEFVLQNGGSVDEFERLIPEGPPFGKKTIEILNDFVSGPTLFWPNGDKNYKIALNVAEVNFNQIAFQFTQELCRVYCNPYENNWLIQLFCHITAFYILDFLGIKWKDNPPREELKDYWYNFDSYKSNLLGAAFSKVDMVKYQLNSEWVKYQVEKIRTSRKVVQSL